MFNLFRDRPADVKTIRNLLLQFIKEKLQRAEGGEGANITGIHLFINCTYNERPVYESAVFANNPGKFKLVKVDGGKDQQVLETYKVTALPVFILFKNGKQVWRRDGVASEKELAELL